MFLLTCGEAILVGGQGVNEYVLTVCPPDSGSGARLAEDPGVLFGLHALRGVRPRGQGAPDAPRASPRVEEHHQDQVFAQV